MKKSLSFCLALSLTMSAQAATMYILPSDTLLSGNSSWVSFDAAYADFIFTPKKGINLETLSVISPTGEKVALQNTAEGKVRTVFDINLTEKGTYAISSLRKFYYVKYKKKGEEQLQKWRGNKAEFDEKIKDQHFADSVEQVRYYRMRSDTFVTLGAPSENGLKAEKEGYDFDFITHPNDYSVGEKAYFILKKDGQALANAKIKVERANAKFIPNRDKVFVTTNSKGEFSVNWKTAGKYALSITHKSKKSNNKLLPQVRTRYYAIVEVQGE